MLSALDFGFYFDRVLHFYGGLSYRELLDLPIRTFWRLSSNIGRIRAEADMRSFRVAVAAQSTRPHEFNDSLVVELGEVTQFSPETLMARDENAFARVKQLMGQK